MTVPRSLGLRTIMYIDDILNLAESKTLAKEHTAGLVYLLENLGFVINYPKSQLTPSQEVEFLGFIINSNTMELKLPGEKLKKIRAETRRLANQTQPQALALSRLLGKLNHATQAILPAPLFYRNLQSCLRVALEEGNQEYSSPIHLTEDCRMELQWWEKHLTNWNGRSLILPPLTMAIETDASTISWGANHQGIRTGGPWSNKEKRMHINCLELLAATLAIKCFARDKTNIMILLKVDNTTAI